MHFMKFYDKLVHEYDINSFSHEQEMTLFIDFLLKIIKQNAPQNISYCESYEMTNLVLDGKKYLEKNISQDQLKESRIKCWKLHDEKTGLIKSIYRIIVICLYEESMKNDSSSQFMPFELYLALLNKIDDTYPEKFYDYFADMQLEILCSSDIEKIKSDE